MSQVEIAGHRLFDADALGATNFHVFPGASRDSTREQVAEQVNRVLSQLEAGDFEEAVLD